MTNKLVLPLFIAFTLHMSCVNNKTPPDKNEQDSIQLISYSYDTPIFVNDQRIKKIIEIAPDLHKIFKKHASEKNIPGISYGIVVGDTLILASSTGVINIENKTPATVNSSFRIASMTKSFTAMAIMKLRDEGELSLKEPVSKYIPELAKLNYLTSDSPILDIENLLTMTAGFPEDNPWGDRQLAISDKALIDLISEGLSLSKIPSYEFEYSNTGYAMLGYIIAQISGMPYQDYIKKNILEPLGMSHTYWEYANVPKEHLAQGYRWEDEEWKIEPMLHDGAYGAMGGLITSIEDFSTYVSFHLSAWPARSDKDLGPVKRSTLREMQTPQYNFLNTRGSDWNDEPCASMIGYGYGLGIAMDCKQITRISHGGALPGFGSNYRFFPKYGIGLMAFGNLTYTRPIPLDQIEKLLFETLKLQPRELPVSEILVQRKEQIVQLLNTWDSDLEKEIIADNFYLDKSKEKRKAEIQEILDKAGNIEKVEKIAPRNQLRGGFKMHAKNGEINIFFTLTPENIPKVQQMNISFKPNVSI